MENHFEKPFTFDRVARIVFSIIIIAVVLLFINSIKSVLLPFLVAWLIAYIINPVVEWNQRILRLQKRTPAIFITFGEIAV
ncbi:MAG: AI-2E family transporter, partial [Bacteroidaceae bacterium]|nr:AI-2E family transporter [Bacteroidaceae bacterium]